MELLPPASGNDNVLNAGMHCFFYPLDEGFVDNWKHFLRLHPFVAGRKRVPRPAAGKTALRTFGIIKRHCTRSTPKNQRSFCLTFVWQRDDVLLLKVKETGPLWTRGRD